MSDFDRATMFLFQLVDEYRDAGFTPVCFGLPEDEIYPAAEVRFDHFVDAWTSRAVLPCIDGPVLVVLPNATEFSSVANHVRAIRHRQDDVLATYFPEQIVKSLW